MRAAAATAMAMVLSLGAAQAGTYVFKDVLRPGGIARGMDAKLADAQRCGADADGQFSHDIVTEYKRCMRQHGWVVQRYIPDPPGASRDPRLAPGDDYIDQTTGMSCRNSGGAQICGTPRGTVHYRNDEGLNCTRSGIVEVCSSF
jgi:hypothetical protein